MAENRSEGLICCGHTTEIMVNIKDQQYLTENCQNLVHKFLSVTLRNFRQGIFPKILAIFQSLHFAFCWILAQTRESGNQSG